jgi:hypothetical protein
MRSRYKAKFKILRRRTRRITQHPTGALNEADGRQPSVFAPWLKLLPQMLQIVIVLLQTWKR